MAHYKKKLVKMASQYDKKVKPRLNEIKDWYNTLTMAQIAKELDVGLRTLQRYAKEHKELADCFCQCKKSLSDSIRASLKKAAVGYYYTEVKKIYETDEAGNVIGNIKVEETTKYAKPDVAAAHLTLKNIDDAWRSDDRETINIKREKLELDKIKMENESW